jgi:hypothetical protein
VKVGTPAKDFKINKSMLSESSEFFKSALAPEWLEGKSRIVRLPDDDPESFKAYVAWLYTRRVYLGTVEEEKVSYTYAFKVYVLGDKLLDTSFKDAVADAVVTMFTTVRKDGHVRPPFAVEVCYLYENTVVGSPLRRAVVHRWARISNWKEVVTDEFPSPFLLDLCKEIAAKVTEKPEEATLVAATRCAFHEHTAGVENCYRNKRA